MHVFCVGVDVRALLFFSVSIQVHLSSFAAQKTTLLSVSWVLTEVWVRGTQEQYCSYTKKVYKYIYIHIYE